MDKHPCNDCIVGWTDVTQDEDGVYTSRCCHDECERYLTFECEQEAFFGENLSEAVDILKPIIQKNLHKFKQAWEALAR